MRHPIYFILGTVLFLISFAFVYLLLYIPGKNLILNLALTGLISVIVLFATMFAFWSIVGKQMKFYQNEIRIEQFLKLPRFDKIAYSDIERVEDFVPKNLHQQKVYSSHPYFFVYTRKGVRPKKIVLLNEKDETLGVELKTFLRSKI